MKDYQDDGVINAPISAVWKLIESHLDDGVIHSIHPEILEQSTESRGTPESIVRRVIDVRGKRMPSRWKLTLRPPSVYRWEVLDGDGPWQAGTYIENAYSEVPGGTRIVSHGQLYISVLPFFLPQGAMIRRILGQIEAQDEARLAQSGRG
ncbi:MAG TPA: SRPBCC family protein [Thermoplasmata archaeon]|nr:SRPBCC family protein [Thermoplasmata archaeon]